MQNVTHIVLHYSATYEDQKVTVADIIKWHKDRGFRTIGYHLVFYQDGSEHKGRPLHEVGAHVGGQNSGKLGLCYIGGLKRATGPNKGHNTMTKAQEEAIIHRIRELLIRWPRAEVVGHNDLANTQCPGFDVRAWWSRISQDRPRAENAVSTAAPVRTSDMMEDHFHIVERGETLSSIARMHGIPLVALLSMNNTRQDAVLHVGDRLRVVETSSDNFPTMPPIVPDLPPSPMSRIMAWFRSWFGN